MEYLVGYSLFLSLSLSQLASSSILLFKISSCFAQCPDNSRRNDLIKDKCTPSAVGFLYNIIEALIQNQYNILKDISHHIISIIFSFSREILLK